MKKIIFWELFWSFHSLSYFQATLLQIGMLEQTKAVH